MTKNFLAYGILALLVSMSSCTNDEGEEQPNVDLKPIPQVVTRAQQTEFSKVSNAFGNKLFNVLSSQPEAEGKNICVAPLSMQYTLSFLANGAKDAICQQMVKAMGFESIDYLNAENRSLLEKLSQDDDYVKVSLANSIWLDNDFGTPNADYVSLLQRCYDASVNMVDFRKDYNAVQQKVNAWAKEKTNDFVSQVPLGLHRDTKMVSVNVCNFYGKWAYPFNPQATLESLFNNYDGTQSHIKLMFSYQGLSGYADEQLEIAELPYGQGYYTMMLVMPRNTEQLDEIAANADWWGWHEKISIKWDQLAVPRFTISSEWPNIESLFPSLGMSEKLEVLCDKIFPNEIQLGNITQSVVLKVDENGTKASSASGNMNDEYIDDVNHRLILNKPFIFAIRENTTGAILFMGKVVKL